MAIETPASFNHAPEGWTPQEAVSTATQLGVNLIAGHWDVIDALQTYFDAHQFPRRQELNDALEERFHSLGGLKYVYTLLPSGPVSTGCELAGLSPPAGSRDLSFGSAV